MADKCFISNFSKNIACNLLKQKVWYFYQSLSKSKCQIVKLISTLRTSPKNCHFGNGKITFKGQNKPTSSTEPTWKICNWTQWTASVLWYFSYQVQFSIFRITEHLSLWVSGQISPINYNGNLESEKTHCPHTPQGTVPQDPEQNKNRRWNLVCK